MKKWRVGTTAMGLFLIFLGAGLIAARLNPGLGAVLMRNSWPVVLLAMGIELLLANYFLNKAEVKYTYDLMSVLFVGLIGLISLGVYTVQEVGLWDRLTEVVNGSARPIQYQLQTMPAAGNGKVILDAAFFHAPVRVWDSSDGRVRVEVHGYTYGRATGQELAATAGLEQQGRTVLITLRSTREAPPWSAHADRVDITMPAGMDLVIEHPDNLDIHTGEFHGKVTGVDERP